MALMKLSKIGEKEMTEPIIVLDEVKVIVNTVLSAFEDGVADALETGELAEYHPQMHYYKRGYDFGIAQYSELKKLEETID